MVGSEMNGTVMGVGRILSTAIQWSNPSIHHSYAIPAGTWLSSIQAEMKVIKNELQIVHIEDAP